MSTEREHYKKYFLSTEGYYFKYRYDRYDASVERATLYSVETGKEVDDVRVSEGYGLPGKTHTDVINYFEVRVQLKDK